MLKKKDKQGLLLLCGVFIILAALLLLKARLEGRPRADQDNCVGRISANTVIVLDYTDRIADQTRDEIVARTMWHLRTQVRVNERVSVFTVSDLAKKSLRPVLSLCKPPEDGNRAIENVQAVRTHFLRDFEKPVREALSVAPEEGNESPIAQALTDISLSQYLRGEINTLLIFSDMLEHTDRFSLYKCNSTGRTIALYRASRTGSKERPEFANTQVKLNLIPRLDQPKEVLQCRDQLWNWFFGDNRGAQASLSIDYLPGGPPMGKPGRE
jgi:hypothetical protein